MEASTSTVNTVINQISNAVRIANNLNMNIGISFAGEYFNLICFEKSLIRSINLEDHTSIKQLNDLLKDVHDIIPATQAMQGAS